jgi:hypothetical protein
VDCDSIHLTKKTRAKKPILSRFSNIFYYDCDSLTFKRPKSLRKPILVRIADIFRYKQKERTVLDINREIIRKHLPIPKSGQMRAFWVREIMFLNRLRKKFPDNDFWLRIEFKPIPYDKTNRNGRLLELRTFAQFFKFPFQDQLKQKYAEFHFKLDKAEEAVIYEKKFGEDVKTRTTIKTIRNFLNG